MTPVAPPPLASNPAVRQLFGACLDKLATKLWLKTVQAHGEDSARETFADLQAHMLAECYAVRSQSKRDARGAYTSWGKRYERAQARWQHEKAAMDRAARAARELATALTGLEGGPSGKPQEDSGVQILNPLFTQLSVEVKHYGGNLLRPRGAKLDSEVRRAFNGTMTLDGLVRGLGQLADRLDERRRGGASDFDLGQAIGPTIYAGSHRPDDRKLVGIRLPDPATVLAAALDALLRAYVGEGFRHKPFDRRKLPVGRQLHHDSVRDFTAAALHLTPQAAARAVANRQWKRRRSRKV